MENLRDQKTFKVLALTLRTGVYRDGYAFRFEWPDGETPWTDTIESACAYTCAAPKRITVTQAKTAMRKAKLSKAKPLTASTR